MHLGYRVWHAIVLPYSQKKLEGNYTVERNLGLFRQCYSLSLSLSVIHTHDTHMHSHTLSLFSLPPSLSKELQFIYQKQGGNSLLPRNVCELIIEVHLVYAYMYVTWLLPSNHRVMAQQSYVYRLCPPVSTMYSVPVVAMC